MHAFIYLMEIYLPPPALPTYVIGTILGAGVTAGNRIGISYCLGAYVPTGEPGTSI